MLRYKQFCRNNDNKFLCIELSTYALFLVGLVAATDYSRSAGNSEQTKLEEVQSAANNGQAVICSIKGAKVVFQHFPAESDPRPEAKYARLALTGGACTIP